MPEGTADVTLKWSGTSLHPGACVRWSAPVGLWLVDCVHSLLLTVVYGLVLLTVVYGLVLGAPGGLDGWYAIWEGQTSTFSLACKGRVVVVLTAGADSCVRDGGIWYRMCDGLRF